MLQSFRSASIASTFLAALSAGTFLSSPLYAEAPKPAPGLNKINHIIVIYLENRSFDNLYGMFPGANGIANAGDAATQIDKEGKVYAVLPPVLNSNRKTADGKYSIDTRFPTDLPNKPYRSETFANIEQVTGDAWHRYYQEQLQINDGKMNKFVAWSDAGSLVMSYYDGSRLPLWDTSSWTISSMRLSADRFSTISIWFAVARLSITTRPPIWSRSLTRTALL